jgi:hypothetical protein
MKPLVTVACRAATTPCPPLGRLAAVFPDEDLRVFAPLQRSFSLVPHLGPFGTAFRGRFQTTTCCANGDVTVVSDCGKGALEASGRDQGDGAQSPTAPALLFYAGIDHGLLNAVDGEGVGAVPPRTASGSPAPGSTVPSTDRWHSPAAVAAHDRLGVVSDEMRGWYPAHLLDGDVIYAQSPAGLFAFDARSGELLWENAEAAGTPSGRLYVACDLLVTAFRPRRGRHRPLRKSGWATSIRARTSGATRCRPRPSTTAWLSTTAESS